jgi:ketosteroid isomerase-like protein/limonene-1,2-epoxide hydrolase
MPGTATLEAFIAKVESNAHVDAIRDFYTEDASMRENFEPPRAGRELLMAGEAKTLERAASLTSRCVRPVFVSGDHVVIRWVFEFTWKAGGGMRMEELAYQRWRGERICEEQFFYDPKQRVAAAMSIDTFMQGYKAAWEARQPAAFAALFHPDGEYCNTPFATQRGHAQLAEYWKRVQLQEDVRLEYDVLSRSAAGGIAHWRTTYQVASEELFRIWAQSTGTNLVVRRPGDPLPRMILDGVLHAEFDGNLCRRARIWWHSMPQP